MLRIGMWAALLMIPACLTSRSKLSGQSCNADDSCLDGYRLKLTFKNGAGAEDLRDFPVLVKLNAARPGFRYTDTAAAGAGLRFVDADSQVLSHEVEVWNPDGDSFVWVRVPQIDAASDSDYIWMYAALAETAAGARAEVWSQCRGVWHLSENTSGPGVQVSDSGPFHNHGATFGLFGPAQVATGVVGGAVRFDGPLAVPADNQVILIGEQPDDLGKPSLSIGSESFTYSAWVNVSTPAGAYDEAWDKGGTSAYTNGFSLELGSGVWAAGISDGTTRVSAYFTTWGAPVQGRWVYLAAVVDRQAHELRIFLDGVRVATTDIAAVGDLFASAVRPAVLGNSEGRDTPFMGAVDEVRVEAGARSAAWISAQHQSITDQLMTYTEE